MKTKKYADGGVSYGSDLDSYTRRKIAEIQKPRLEEMREQSKQEGRQVYKEPSVSEGLKSVGLGALNTYGVPIASAVSGAVNVGKDLKDKIKSQIGKPSPYRRNSGNDDEGGSKMKKGGAVKMAKGGSVSSASRRADGCATKGKTKGRMI